MVIEMRWKRKADSLIIIIIIIIIIRPIYTMGPDYGGTRTYYAASQWRHQDLSQGGARRRPLSMFTK